MNKTRKLQPTITVLIEQGTPTPAQREAWRRFWQRLIAEVKSGAKNDGHAAGS